MDINASHDDDDDDDVLDFQQDTNIIDLFNDFYHNHLSTYTQSNNIVNLIFGSMH